MNNIYKITIAILVASLLFISTKQTDIEDQKDRFNETYQIYPAPVPDQIAFAGENLPFPKYEIKERFERELNVNTFWQSNSLLILKRTRKYFDIIEPILAKYGVPDDFKYLAVAESGLQNATSSAGAKGVWQFMKSSGQKYGLEITSQVDERYHLERATEAACLYLKEAHSRFGSWTLAAAAYNRGMSGISRDLSKQLVTDYYDLHLNSETSRYILRIIAFKAIIENPSNYGFRLEDKDFYSNMATRSILVDSTIANIAEFAVREGTTYHIIKSLNPWIKGNSIQVKDRPYTISAPLNE
jgi:hypothetical protein